MQAIMTGYARTKVEDEPIVKEVKYTQDMFSIVAIDESGTFKLTGRRFSRTYTLSDINFMGSTEEEQKGIIIAISKVLNAMPCRFQITVANQYVDPNSFNDSILYEEKGDDFDDLRNNYNKVIKEKLTDARQGLYQSIYITLTVEADNFSDAKAEYASIESAVRSAFISIGTGGMQGSVMKLLSINERMQMLYNFTHTGIKNYFHFDMETEFLSKNDWVNTISPAAIRYNNEDFEMNGKYGRVLYIANLPNTLESDVIIRLSKTNCTSFISINSELIDSAALKKELNRKDMSIGMKIEGQKSRNRANNDYLSDASGILLSTKEKLDKLRNDIDTQDDHFFNTTLMIAFLADTREELNQITEKMESVASIKSLKLKPCFAKQREGLNTTLPLGIQEFKRCINLSASCEAMFVPFKTQELHDEGGTWYGINPISQNAIYADKKLLKNYNGLILGQSGSGKSMFSKNEMVSTYLNNIDDQVIVIDPQAEYGGIANALKGAVISFDTSKDYHLNPLDIDFADLDYAQAQEMIADKADFVISLLSSCTKMDFSAEQKSAIDRVVSKVYAQNFTLRKRLNGGSATLTDYYVPAYMRNQREYDIKPTNLSYDEQVREYSPTMQDIYQGLLDEHTEVCDRLAGSMDIFVNGSLNLFNHRTNVDINKRFIVFDISHLKENLRVTSMLIMLEVVKDKISHNAKNLRWTHIYIDEFHELLGVPQVANFVLKLWKEIRKMKGVLCGITQNMSDLLSNDSSGNLSNILSNTEYFALLSQSSLDKQKLMKFLPQISVALFDYVDNADPGTGLLRMGSVTVPFDMRIRRDSLVYKLTNTDGSGSVAI